MLDPVGSGSVGDVVVGWAPSRRSPIRRPRSPSIRGANNPAGDLARAFADGRIIRTFAFRGATHYMTPEDAGIYLALRARAGCGSFQLADLLRADTRRLASPPGVVRDALTDGPLTRDELGAAITARPKFRHLGFVFETNAWTLLKPIAWRER